MKKKMQEKNREIFNEEEIDEKKKSFEDVLQI